MKYLVLFLFILGCSRFTKERIEIIHDYVFFNGIEICQLHQGLHYIISKTTIFEENNESYPCRADIRIRCQDGSLHKFDTGVKFCFISEMQINETHNEIQLKE
jgi:hypothetical protein